MVSEIDVFRTINLHIRQDDKTADVEPAEPVDAMLEHGDMDGLVAEGDQGDRGVAGEGTQRDSSRTTG